jgi:hypothetical protein
LRQVFRSPDPTLVGYVSIPDFLSSTPVSGALPDSVPMRCVVIGDLQFYASDPTMLVMFHLSDLLPCTLLRPL